MQTLSKPEIEWIIGILNNEIYSIGQQISGADKSPLTEMARLRRENLKSVQNKLQAALRNDDKRIVIK